MLVTILGYENFRSKKGENLSNLYYVKQDEIDPERGAGNKTESAFIFGKKLQPEIGDVYELIYDAYNMNGQMLAKVVDIKKA